MRDTREGSEKKIFLLPRVDMPIVHSIWEENPQLG